MAMRLINDVPTIPSGQQGWSRSYLETTLRLSGCVGATPRVGITRVLSDSGSVEPTEVRPPGQAFLASLNVCPPGIATYEVSVEGRQSIVARARPGRFNIFNLCSKIVYRSPYRFDMFHYSITRASLDAFTASEGLPNVEDFQSPHGENDSVLYHLSRAILPAMEAGKTPSRTFSDWFALSILTRLVEQYGRVSSRRSRHVGGLAPTHRRRVEEILKERLDGQVGLQELAKQCELSVGHFARAFRQTFGVPVHQCLLYRRIDRAKDLLRLSQQPLSLIAKEIGFADQSTFTESFSRIVGISPGRYRRQVTAFALTPQSQRVLFSESAPGGTSQVNLWSAHL